MSVCSGNETPWDKPVLCEYLSSRKSRDGGTVPSDTTDRAKRPVMESNEQLDKGVSFPLFGVCEVVQKPLGCCPDFCTYNFMFTPSKAHVHHTNQNEVIVSQFQEEIS